MEAIEKEGRLGDSIHALRRLASDDLKLAEVLRTFRILCPGPFSHISSRGGSV